jgi:hypothetical protein
LISLEHVTKSRGNKNLTKFIVKALQKNGGVLEEDMAFKLLSFAIDSVNVL